MILQICHLEFDTWFCEVEKHLREVLCEVSSYVTGYALLSF